MRKRKFGLRKTLLISALSVLAVGTGAGVVAYGSAHAARNIAPSDEAREATYPVQYSDTHITKNAVVSDPRFRNTVHVESAGLLANVSNVIPSSAEEEGPAQIERGTWLWTPLLDITPAYRDSIIAGAKKNGIRNIYLSIDSYLDIYALQGGAQKDGMKKNFDDALERFVAQARRNGMTVDAEGGWRNWAEPGHEYKAFAVLSYAIEYNKTHAEKLRGFQYDVEPYLLDSYAQNKRTALHLFVALMQESVAKLDDSDLKLSVVIPEFYDGSQNDDPQYQTPRYFYGLKYAYTLDHLLDVLDQRAGSRIIVMAYRNVAEGENGIIEIAKDEIAEATGHRTKVVVAEETGDVSPSYVTFHGMPRSYFDEQSDIVERSFANEKSYGGLSTHYINALLALK